MRYIFRFVAFILVNIFRVIRMLTIGVLSGLGVIFFINTFLESSLGTRNIDIIVLSGTFIPIFTVLFIELFLYFQRRSSKLYKKEKEEKMYKLV